MQGRVTYPFRVKHNGEYYDPGTVIDVDDVEAALASGATGLEGFRAEEEKPEEEEKPADKPKRGRKPAN